MKLERLNIKERLKKMKWFDFYHRLCLRKKMKKKKNLVEVQILGWVGLAWVIEFCHVENGRKFC